MQPAAGQKSERPLKGEMDTGERMYTLPFFQSYFLLSFIIQRYFRQASLKIQKYAILLIVGILVYMFTGLHNFRNLPMSYYRDNLMMRICEMDKNDMIQ